MNRGSDGEGIGKRQGRLVGYVPSAEASNCGGVGFAGNKVKAELVKKNSV